jgi:lysophospholipase L1-like esterase
MLFSGSISRSVLVLLLTAAVPLTAQTNNAFFLHDGDAPVVFVGDSITEQRMYTALIEAYTLSRFPSWKMTFRNSGWSGDKAWLQLRGADFDTALQRDVISLQPKVVTIDYGMNDARDGDAGFAKYIEYEAKLTESLAKAGARVVLVTSTPEERFEKNAPAGSSFNLILKKFADGLKDVAAKENVPYIDQFTPFVKAIDDGRAAGVLSTDPSANPMLRLISPDGVHPELGGHFLMASAPMIACHGLCRTIPASPSC